jgi:hypothetical protein
MVRLFVMELIYLNLNFRFNVAVLYLWLIILSVINVVLSTVKRYLTDFMNLKIKLIQFFEGADKICAYIFIEVSTHTYINICIYISKKKQKRESTRRRWRKAKK